MKYFCENHRPITASGFKDAAEVFARRKARTVYGRRGEAVIVNESGYSVNGDFVQFDCFIGTRQTQRGARGWVGHNVIFTVSRPIHKA